MTMPHNVAVSGNNAAQCGSTGLSVATMGPQFIGTLQHKNDNNWDNIDQCCIVNVS